jgi:predicted membrane-bound mannosyltransferase
MEYLLVFLGAAIPWLEIAIVVPLGIIAGLSPIWVMAGV